MGMLTWCIRFTDCIVEGFSFEFDPQIYENKLQNQNLSVLI